MGKKKLTLLWRKLDSLELGKDVVLVPYYLGKALECRTEICCGYSEGTGRLIPAMEKKGVRFVKAPLGHNPYLRIPVYVWYLLRHAPQTDLLMCFHWRPETLVSIWLYKLLNRRGLVYIKLDTGSGEEWELSRRSFPVRWLKKRLYTLCLKKTDVLSCETSQAYEALCRSRDFGGLMPRKLVLMPNAFDEELLSECHIQERDFQRKENLIITVGRLGSPQKNTGMILEALAQTDLKEWRFVFIGPVESGFGQTVEQFFRRHPAKREQVAFTGKIEEKKELWEWYNRAKVFVCTSRWESYGIVLNEAKRFRNYLVSTRVGAAEDLIGRDRYGCYVPQEDSAALGRILSQIAEGGIGTDVYRDYDVRELSYGKAVGAVAGQLRPFLR